jgi:hypothetical protein
MRNNKRGVSVVLPNPLDVLKVDFKLTNLRHSGACHTDLQLILILPQVTAIDELTARDLLS